MTAEPRYIPFPLFLLSELPDNLDAIFNYGIYAFAKKITYRDLNVVLTQILYAFYRQELPSILKKKLDQLVKRAVFVPDEDYRGFSTNGQEFNPEKGIQELSEAACLDTDFEIICIEFWQMRQALSILNIKGKIETIILSAKLIQKQIDERARLHRTDVTVMISISMMFDYYNKTKSEYEIDLLRGFLSIKSILGNKKIVGTTKDYILMRMTGAKNKNLLTELLTKPDIKRLHTTYSKRYQIDKLLSELLSRGFITGKLGYNRRIYFSTHFTTVEMPHNIHQLLTSTNSKIKRDANHAVEVKARAQLKALIKNSQQHLNK